MSGADYAVLIAVLAVWAIREAVYLMRKRAKR